MDDFIFGLMAVMYVLLCVAAIVSALLKIRAIIRHDSESAMLYESMERFCLMFAFILLLGAILLASQTLMAQGFAKIFQYFEVLTNG